MRRGTWRGTTKGTSEGSFVWFSLELKFNSFELDSEVGRLVLDKYLSPSEMCNIESDRFNSIQIMDPQVEGRRWRRPMLEIKLNLLLFESIKVILDIITLK